MLLTSEASPLLHTCNPGSPTGSSTPLNIVTSVFKSPLVQLPPRKKLYFIPLLPISGMLHSVSTLNQSCGSPVPTTILTPSIVAAPARSILSVGPFLILIEKLESSALVHGCVQSLTSTYILAVWGSPPHTESV